MTITTSNGPNPTDTCAEQRERICGSGLSCELICPNRRPGEPCNLTLEAFAALFD